MKTFSPPNQTWPFDASAKSDKVIRVEKRQAHTWII